MIKLKPLSIAFFSQYRYFNWKYPYPRELQPSPQPIEKIDPNNIVVPENSYTDNDVFNKEYINRNPRNLEQMLLQIKPNGYILDDPSVIFWNKLQFEKSLKHTSIKVVHNSGEIVVSASTHEWCIRKHLKSTIDRTAVVNVARIFAQRCLESGILFVHQDFTRFQRGTNKIKLLLQTLQEEGLETKELTAIRLKDQHSL